MTSQNTGALVDHLFRQEAGRMVAILTRLFGIHNLELAEDVLQDTLHQALKDWSLDGIPDNPAGWLMVVAKRKAINMIRREKYLRNFAADMDNLLKSEWTTSYTVDHIFLEDEIKDSQLRMIFTCCHPSLPAEAQVALTLKTLCGFSIYEIASALPSSVIKLNLAIITGKKDGPHAAIAALHELEKGKTLENYYLFYASLGEYYTQAGKKQKALGYFIRAKTLTKSAATREVLDRKIGACG